MPAVRLTKNELPFNLRAIFKSRRCFILGHNSPVCKLRQFAVRAAVMGDARLSSPKNILLFSLVADVDSFQRAGSKVFVVRLPNETILRYC